MISYRMRPIPINIDGAIYDWRRSGRTAKSLIRKLKPVIQFWVEYPGFGSKFGYAQAYFEQRLLQAGYDLEKYRNDALRFLPIYDQWADPWEYPKGRNGRYLLDKRGVIVKYQKKYPSPPIRFRTHPIWKDCDEQDDSGQGYVYFLIGGEILKTYEGDIQWLVEPGRDESAYINSQKQREMAGHEFREFLLDKVGACPISVGMDYMGSWACESEYLRYWIRAKLTADEILTNLEYLLEHRRRLRGLAPFGDQCLDIPVKIPAGRIGWGRHDSATDSISTWQR